VSVIVPESTTSNAGLEIRRAVIRGSLHAETLMVPSGGFVDVAAPTASLCVNNVELKQRALLRVAHNANVGKCERSPVNNNGTAMELGGSLTMRYFSRLIFLASSADELATVFIRTDGDIFLKDGSK